jgi:hypothetical protein
MDTQPQTPPEATDDDDLRFAPSTAEVEPAAFDTMIDTPAQMLFVPPTDDLDIDAALAAVATLDDLLAEQEAAEQARLAREQAEADARAERQSRLKNPELFFPMPSLAITAPGRLDSIIPALALIGIGAWLTLTTTSGVAPASAVVVLLILGAIGLTLLARWLSTGRWSIGNLFFGLLVLLESAAIYALSTSIGLATGWPVLIATLGLTFLVTGAFARRRLVFPGLAFLLVGVIAYAVTSGLLILPVLR